MKVEGLENSTVMENQNPFTRADGSTGQIHTVMETTLVWSFDGKYILVEDYYGADFPFTGRVLLVDLANLAVVKIAENATPIGWMQP